MAEASYDHINFVSFPSSLKVTDLLDEDISWGVTEEYLRMEFDVKKGDIVGIEAWGKGENVGHPWPTHTRIRFGGGNLSASAFPVGDYDWVKREAEAEIPADGTVRADVPIGSKVVADMPGIQWIDDFRVIYNGDVIYEDSFSEYTPYKIGGGLAAGAGLLVLIIKKGRK